MSLEDGIPEHALTGGHGIYKTEGALAVEAKADAMIEKARMNEAIVLIEQLEKEVSDMQMPSRFSRTKKPAESVYRMSGTTVHALTGLTEDEYKRQTLLITLIEIKNSILDSIAHVKSVIEDIEATKQESLED